jgi:PKD repeat protein
LHIVTLTVTDFLGRTATDQQAVNVFASGPSAYFDFAQRDDGTLTIDFDAGLSGSPNGIDLYGWKFGDGTQLPPTTVNISHTFASPGTYSVSLLVIDAAMGRTDTIVIQIIVQ